MLFPAVRWVHRELSTTGASPATYEVRLDAALPHLLQLLHAHRLQPRHDGQQELYRLQGHRVSQQWVFFQNEFNITGVKLCLRLRRNLTLSCWIYFLKIEIYSSWWITFWKHKGVFAFLSFLSTWGEAGFWRVYLKSFLVEDNDPLIMHR